MPTLATSIQHSTESTSQVNQVLKKESEAAKLERIKSTIVPLEILAYFRGLQL